MPELYRYAAFISYSSKDAAFAKRLHRALESYRIPSSLGKFDLIGGGKKNRIYPVFRDREELSAGHLGDQIEANLRASAALIVVCSPNGAASPWVRKEIEFFAAQGRHAKIFAIIPDTAPLTDEHGADCTQACFPPAFHGDALSGDKLEPLAADARKGKDGFRNAWLKIVAGMIGVTPGQIIDRDRKRQRQMAVKLGAGVAAAVLALAAVGASVDALRWRGELTAHALKLADEGRSFDAASFALAGLPAAGDVLGAVPPNAAGAVDRAGALVRIAVDYGDRFSFAIYSSDDKFLLHRAENGEAALYDLRDPTQRPRDLGRIARLGYEFIGTTRAIIRTDSGEGQILDLTRPTAPARSLGPVLDFLPHDPMLVIWRAGGNAELHDLRTPDAAPVPLGPIKRGLLSVRFSADKRFFTTLDATGVGSLRRVDAPNTPLRSLGPVRTAGTLFSSNNILLVHSPEGLVTQHDLDNLAAQPMALGRMRSDFIVPWRVHAVVEDTTGEALVVDLRVLGGARRAIGRIPTGAKVTLSEDGRFLTIDQKEESVLVDVGTRAMHSLGALEADIGRTFSPKARYLAVRRLDGEGLLYDLSAPTAAPRAFGELARRVPFRFSPDNKFVATRAWDGVASLHDLTNPGAAPVDLGRTNDNYPLAFTDDGRFLITWTPRGGGAILDLGDPQRTARSIGSVQNGLPRISHNDRYVLVSDEVQRAVLRDLSELAPTSGPGVRPTVCAASGAALRPFGTETRTGDSAPAVRAALTGRPWNPCDWRGLFAITPDPARGDGWFEGAQQWLRLVSVRLFGGKDWTCAETVSHASVQMREARKLACERFASRPEPAPEGAR